MLPIAVFPAAALLMGIGYALEESGMENLYFMAMILQKTGNVIISQMPMIFAIGVAYELSDDKSGLAACNGLLCFLIITSLLSVSNVSFLEDTLRFRVDEAFGNINNQFIGILSGLLAAFSYRRKHVSTNYLPADFRVLVYTSIFAMLCSIVLYIVWPLIFTLLISIGTMIKDMGPLGAGIYAFLNRLLVPLGLHHMLNSIFWFDVIGINDIGNYWAGTGIRGVTGMYQAGYYPIMMFGVVAMALAMYQCCFITRKKKMKPFFVSSAIASFLTGVTEPLELSFMFLSPLLYVMHALLTGISVFMAASLQYIAGFSFSAGAIDFVLASALPMAVKPYMLFVQGGLFFVIYYVLFRLMIKKFDLCTPGRENDQNEPFQEGSIAAEDLNEMAKVIIEGCGGAENIIAIHSCITRLHITLKDQDKFVFKRIRQNGAAGYLKTKEEIQIVYGAHVDAIMDVLKNYQL